MIQDRDYSYYRPIEKLKGWNIFYIELPFDVCEHFGKPDPELYTLIEGVEDKGKFTMKIPRTGKYMLMLKNDLLEKLGKKKGDFIRVRFKDYRI